MLLRDGVTGWIDAGSAGADGIDAVVAVAKASPQPGRVLINIGRGGILPDGDTKDLALADVGAARAAIERHRDYVVGIKARLSETVVGTNDVEVLKRTQQAVEPLGLPVMIHMGQSPSSLRELLPLLEARRHRDALVRAAAERNRRRRRPAAARGARGAPARHRVRRRQRRAGPHSLGHRSSKSCARASGPTRSRPTGTS